MAWQVIAGNRPGSRCGGHPGGGGTQAGSLAGAFGGRGAGVWAGTRSALSSSVRSVPSGLGVTQGSVSQRPHAWRRVTVAPWPSGP